MVCSTARKMAAGGVTDGLTPTQSADGGGPSGAPGWRMDSRPSGGRANKARGGIVADGADLRRRRLGGANRPAGGAAGVRIDRVVMQELLGRRYADPGDDAKPPESSLVPPDEAPLGVPGSPSAGGWATNDLLPGSWAGVLFRFHSPAGLEPTVCVARVGPTTPTRARRPFDASVDHTEARNACARLANKSDEPRG